MLLHLFLTGKKIKVEPVKSSFKDKIMSYCDELPFPIISPLIVILILKQWILLILMMKIKWLYLKYSCENYYEETPKDCLYLAMKLS